MKIKINIKDNVGLCGKCKYAHIMEHGGTVKIRCKMMGDKLVAERVTVCNKFYEANLPYVHEMEELAWILKTNEKNAVGFKPERTVKFEPPSNDPSTKNPFDV
jgi:hypothetical protein